MATFGNALGIPRREADFCLGKYKVSWGSSNKVWENELQPSRERKLAVAERAGQDGGVKAQSVFLGKPGSGG